LIAEYRLVPTDVEIPGSTPGPKMSFSSGHGWRLRAPMRRVGVPWASVTSMEGPKLNQRLIR